VILWDASIALLPFWRFDAKGGEVVLLGRGFAWVGRKHLPLFHSFYLLACALFSVELCVLDLHGLYKTLSCVTLCSCMELWNSGFILWNYSYGILDLSMEYGIVLMAYGIMKLSIDCINIVGCA
jgi:hypothetical protein